MADELARTVVTFVLCTAACDGDLALPGDLTIPLERMYWGSIFAVMY